MGRVKTAQRKRGGHREESMKTAMELAKAGMSIRQASKQCDLKYPTVRLYVNKYKINPNVRLTPNYEVNRVFTSDQEKKIVEYIEYCAKLFYGLTTKDCRRVAYQMAKANNVKIPPSWQESEMAGFEWLRSFRKRYPELSLRKPEACSLARATAFNKHNIEAFFRNLKSVMERHPTFADGTRVFNLDETSTTTVQRPGKVLALKGKNVAKVTSGERGILVTTCCIVSATGQALPPVMVFPRKKFQTHMIHGAPPGTLGLAAGSGWMNSELFVDVMKHFIRHVSASNDNPALLIMDNHESHLSIDALDLAKSSGVTILTLHPHTTAKLQPLDVGLNGPFKTYYNAAVDSWLLRNPGKSFTIYNIAECVGVAYMKAMTPINIINAFKKTGIFPFDDLIFTEDDFMPSSVTDRPLTVEETEERQVENLPSPSLLNDAYLQLDSLRNLDITPPIIDALVQSLPPTPSPPSNQANSDGQHVRKYVQLNSFNSQDKLPTPSITNNLLLEYSQPIPSTSKTLAVVSPMDFMPPIKAKPRDPKRRRVPGRSIIATDTPEKEAIIAKKMKGTKKQVKKAKQYLFPEKKTIKKSIKNKITAKFTANNETSDEEEFLASGSSSGGEQYISENEDEAGEIILDGDFSPLTRGPREQEFVLVLFPYKKSSVYYIAKVLEIIDDPDEDSDYFVSFLRLKSRARQTFCDPIEPDTAGIQVKDVKYILPDPKITGSSRRQAAFSFGVYFDLSKLNLR